MGSISSRRRLLWVRYQVGGGYNDIQTEDFPEEGITKLSISSETKYFTIPRLSHNTIELDIIDQFGELYIDFPDGVFVEWIPNIGVLERFLKDMVRGIVIEKIKNLPLISVNSGIDIFKDIPKYFKVLEDKIDIFIDKVFPETDDNGIIILPIDSSFIENMEDILDKKGLGE